MNRLARAFLFAIAALGAATIQSHAQTTSATVVAACGTPPITYTAGANRAITQDTTGSACTNATLTGSVTVGTLGPGSNTIGNVGIINGANQAAVKAASTAPVATDPALVVTLSPNSSSSSNPVTVTVNSPPDDLLTGPTSLTGAGDVAVASHGAGAAALQVTGTFTGLAGVIRGSIDGTNYVNIGAYNANSGAVVTSGTTISATGIYIIPAGGYRSIQYHVTAVSTGTAVVNLNSSAGSLDPPSAVSGNGKQVNLSGINGSTPSTGNGVTGSGSQRVTIASDNTAFSVNPQPTTSGGLSVKSFIVANNTTSVAVDASAGQIYGITGSSISAATPVWAKFYNASQGSTTCGSGTPVQRELIPAPGASGGGTNISVPLGIPYSTAITVCVTAGIADNDTTSPAASSYILNVYYK